jgi:hypothetical protein
MESMSHDPVAGDIGSQLVDIALQGLDSAASAVMSLTSLIPAGAEEVSMQAALAFATEGVQVLGSNTAAQQELMQTGMALVNIAQMYSQVDGGAASTLGFNAAKPLMTKLTEAANNLAGRAGAGLAYAEALPGAAGTAARTPLMGQLIDGVVGGSAAPGLANAASSAPGLANAASSALGAGTAPLSAMGSGASAGGGKAGLVSEVSPDQDENQEPGDQQPSQRTL